MRALLVGLSLVMALQTCLCEDIDPENLDIEKKFEDKEKVEAFFDCMLEVTTKCSEENQLWKDILPAIYASECGECTEKEKELYEKANKLMRENYPGKYDELLKKMKEKAL